MGSPKGERSRRDWCSADLIRQTIDAESQQAPQAGRLIDQLEPTQPVARPTAMRGDNKNFNFAARLPIQDVVRKAQYSITPNTRGELDTIRLRVLTDLDHCRLKGSKITRAETRSALLVVGHVLKVFDARRLAEEVVHLSKAWAWRRTSSAGTRFVNP